jgi:hypothetical protein
MSKLKYCIECHLEKDEAEHFAKGSYFCRRCKERNKGELYLETEPSIESIFRRLDEAAAKKKPKRETAAHRETHIRLSKEDRKKLKREYKNGRK